MKTTLDLPDELMRAVKIRAAQDGRLLKDVMADAVRRGLDAKPERDARLRRRVRFPLIPGTRPARPGGEITPDRVAGVLLEQEVAAVLER